MTAIALSPATDNVAPITSPFSKYLQELLEDGIYLLFLLRNSNAPNSLAEFNKRIDLFLDQFETNARNLGKPPAAVSDAKYAFCALMDEIILSSEFAIREDWERAPLQLRLFGEHLAGEPDVDLYLVRRQFFPSTKQGWIKHFRAVCSRKDKESFVRIKSIHLCK